MALKGKDNIVEHSALDNLFYATVPSFVATTRFKFQNPATWLPEICWSFLLLRNASPYHASSYNLKGKATLEQNWPTLSELIPVSLARSRLRRSIATPPGWDASPSQVTPQHFCRRYPFILLSCPRTQHNDPGQGSNPDHSIRSPTH